MQFPTYLSVFDCLSLPDLALSASWVLQAKTCTIYGKINQPLTKRNIYNILLVKRVTSAVAKEALLSTI